MSVLTQYEYLEFIISICMYTSIFFLVFTLILNLDICLEIVGEFIRRIGYLFERAKDWIWWKTHKKDDLTHKKDDLTHEQSTLDFSWGWSMDEASEAWRKAMEFEEKELEALCNDN